MFSSGEHGSPLHFNTYTKKQAVQNCVQPVVLIVY